MMFIQQDYQWLATEKSLWGYISQKYNNLATVKMQMCVQELVQAATYNHAKMYPHGQSKFFK